MSRDASAVSSTGQGLGSGTATPIAVARAPGTSAGSSSEARSTKHAPSACRPAIWWASASAIVVLPMPPVPTIVTKRLCRSLSDSAASTCSRPTMPVSRDGSGRTAADIAVTTVASAPGASDAAPGVVRPSVTVITKL